MEHLDPNLQIRSPELSSVGSGGAKLEGRSEVAAYPQPYSDPSLLHFAGSEPLASPPLSFPPHPDPSSFQYALSASALSSAHQHPQHQQHQHQRQDSKKDIKRRTKTGCLTCRKRRIKCDEAQPVCNNCRKSKRDCQGYDPLFRNQQSPATIQPAATTDTKSVASSQQLASTQSAYPDPPDGYAAVQTSSYPVATMAHVPNEPATFDFSAAIDPALQNQVAPLNMNPSLGPGSLFAPAQDEYQVDVGPTTIEELVQVAAPLSDIPMPPPITDEKRPEIKALFGYYSPGLNKFLETQWYQQNGYARLQKHPSLLEKYAMLLSRMEFTADQHPYENQINVTVEAQMIWGSLELAKIASSAAKSQASSTDDNTQPTETEPRRPPDGGHIDLHETALRFDIVKALITNTNLEPSFLEILAKFDNVTPPGFNALSKQLLTRERKFWKYTARFLTLDTATAAPDAVDAALQDMRGLLESKENRDIMYSVAVMRVWPRRLMDREQVLKNEGHAIPQLEESDTKKVDVAKTFLTQQAGGRGTTPASQRLCGMILRGWHPPPFML